MELAHLIAFNIALLAAIISPGPSLLFQIKTTLASGRAAGLAAGVGLGLMAALWTLAALLGLDAIFTLFPWAYGAMKVAGAAYLIWIAIQTWRNANTPVGEGSAAPSHGRAFLTGLLVNLGNPKSVFFAAAVLVVIFPRDLTGVEKAIIFANHFAVELMMQTLFAVLLSTRPVRNRYMAAKPVLDRITATVLGLLGLRLLLSRNP